MHIHDGLVFPRTLRIAVPETFHGQNVGKGIMLWKHSSARGLPFIHKGIMTVVESFKEGQTGGERLEVCALRTSSVN